MPLIEIPEQYLSAMNKRLMTNPVLIPSNIIVDASEILKSSGQPLPQLKESIANFKSNLLSEVQFIQAIVDNNVALLEQKNYTKEHFTLEIRGQTIKDVLSFAFIRQYYALAQHLIENKYPLNKTSRMGFLPLHFAALYGDLESVKMICERAPTLINEPNTAGYTALHHAASTGKDNIVVYLLEAGAKSYLADDDHTPFTLAIENNYLAIAKSLLAQGPMSIGNFYSAHINPLALCVKKNATDLVVNLLEKLATQNRSRLGIDTPDVEGLTPLHVAVKNNNAELVALLIAKGANVNTKDKQHNTLLHTAATNFDGIVLLELLIKAGTAVDYNLKKQSPVDVAHFMGRLDNKALLIRYIIEAIKKTFWKNKLTKFWQNDLATT